MQQTDGDGFSESGPNAPLKKFLQPFGDTPPLKVRAVTDFDNAIDRDPFAAALYQTRGESLVTLGKSDKAIEDFNVALNVNNKSAEAWDWLGVAYERGGSRAKASESYHRAGARSQSANRQTRRLAQLSNVGLAF